VSRFQRQSDGGLRAGATRDLSERGEIGWLSLQQPAEIEELDQAEREAVLETGVEREMHE
jgi:hypothetical protein